MKEGNAQISKPQAWRKEKANSWKGQSASLKASPETLSFHYSIALWLAMRLSYILSNLLPSFLITALRQLYTFTCCMITEIEWKNGTGCMASEHLQSEGSRSQLWACCLLLNRNDVSNVQWHPLGPLFWWAAVHGTPLQNQLLVMFFSLFSSFSE